MKKTAAVIAAFAAVVLAALLAYDGIANKEMSADFFAMNTYVTVKLKGTDSAECAQQAQKITESLDKEVLSRTEKGSLVYNFNQNGGGTFENEKGLFEYISVLLDVSEKSGGAFDFTLGAVSDLWSFGSAPLVPDEAELAQTLSHSGYEKLKFNGESLVYSDKKAVIDFGAAGKGIALDEIRSYLKDKRIKEAVVSVGGSVLLMGDKAFTVGIRNPEGNSGSYIAKLSVPGCCVSTSGNYEQQFEQGGKRYHHILDPETGYPADNGLVSVTIVSESGILSDALSTACFVLGLEKGRKLAAEYGCSAVFVTEDKTVYLEGISEDVIELTDSSYTLVIE